MAFLDNTGLSHLWGKLKAYFVKGNGKVFYGTSDTAAGTATKVVTCSSFTSSDLAKGTVLSVFFSVTNTAAVADLKLNVNNTGAKNVKCNIGGSLANLPAAGYIKANYVLQFIYDGTYWVMQVNRDNNTIGEYAGSCKAGPFGMARYSLIMKVSEDKWEGLVATSSTGTGKTMNTHAFLLDSPILYQSGGTYAENAASSGSATWTCAQGVDTRYSFNCSNTWSETGRPLYLVGTISGGKFYLKPSAWWADALPATNDGYYYWYVGQMTSKYQFALHPLHPVYYVDSSGNAKVYCVHGIIAQGSGGSSYGIPPLFEHYKLDVYAGEDGSFTIINNNCGGFIVTVPFLAKAVRFTKSAGYGQWGACNKDAVLPTVISTGANRVSYTGSYDAGRFELLTNSIESHYFFGGSVGTKYSDFEVELWNGVVLGMPA